MSKKLSIQNDVASGSLPSSLYPTTAKKRPYSRLVLCTLVPLYVLYILTKTYRNDWFQPPTDQPILDIGCSQVAPIQPSKHESLLQELDKLFHTKEFKLDAYESLGGAIRVPTESQDEEDPPSEDPVFWEKFGKLHEYLESRFPLVHARLNVTKVNVYALVYQWQGSDPSLKPLLFAAHQDVVPVEPETASQWKYPPFSGHFDGEWIWGRGSSDDKSNMVADLIAVETLLKNGFEPTRTLVMAFGIDEERGGHYGAAAIGAYLLETYGEDSISMIVDEGGRIGDMYGATFAMPATAEKGYLDVRIEVSTPGGHSSVPPAHTGIGILARMITTLEDHPHQTELRRDGTFYQQLQCIAEHAPSVPSSLRDLIIQSRDSDKALASVEHVLDKANREYKPSTGTTQAVDLIQGGVKTNALPELTHAIVNHRIADYSSVEELQTWFKVLLKPVAIRYNLSMSAFGSEIIADEGNNSGHLRLSDAFNSGLNPAPVTPTFGSDAWSFLSGTIIASLQSSQRVGVYKNVVVAPGLSLGNTDTKWYWKLTKNIFRYGHKSTDDSYNGAHTVNEAIRGEGFLEVIRFATRLILNADETELLA